MILTTLTKEYYKQILFQFFLSLEYILGGAFAGIPLRYISRSEITGPKGTSLCNFARYYDFSVQILYSH